MGAGWLELGIHYSSTPRVRLISLSTHSSAPPFEEEEETLISRSEHKAKIDQDRKRKKTSISSGRKDKHRKKMSSSSKVQASHILIKHEGSRRKSSWKDPEGQIISNTTKETAISQLKAFKEEILSGKAKFGDIAKQHSDCSSAKRGGDLGVFGRGQMQKPFEEATYALKVGEISDIVETDSGAHIIMRTG